MATQPEYHSGLWPARMTPTSDTWDAFKAADLFGVDLLAIKLPSHDPA